MEIWEYLVKKLRDMTSDEKPPTDIEEDKKTLEGISKAIPEGVFPHKGLKKKRERMAELDEQTKE